MTFPHQLLHVPQATPIQLPVGRYYETPDGRFPSVTTVLSAYQDKRYLKAWRERIGDDAADVIVEQSRHRGNQIHKMAELYLMNDPNWCKPEATVNGLKFLEIKQILDNCVDKVYACELPLWSKKLKIAGTTDAVVEWAGKPAILDFKTSKRPVGNNSDKLRFFKLQTTLYAMLVNERYNVNCEYSHIIILIDNEHPKVVSFRNTWFRPVAVELIAKVVLDKSPVS